MSASNHIDKRIAAACEAMRAGLPVVLLDDATREDEADLVAAAETLSHDLMARLIRDCSGIVCLCLDDTLVRQLDLARLAGLKPAAVLCELMDRKGEMLRGKRARAYARRNGFPVLTIAELVQHLGAVDLAA